MNPGLPSSRERAVVDVVKRGNVLNQMRALPLTTDVFPMGFALRIATNSQQVVAAAQAIWSHFPKLSDNEPVQMDVVVTNIGDEKPLPIPVYREERHLLTVTADRNHFATADLRNGKAVIALTESARDEYLNYYFLEPVAYVLVAARHLTLLHASCVALNGASVVLCGDSGAGKTCLAYACARAGWTFLSGDAVGIVRERKDKLIVGRPTEIRFRHSARLLFPELNDTLPFTRANGKSDIVIDPQALHVRTAFSNRANHVVFLARDRANDEAFIEPVSRTDARNVLERDICFGDETIRGRQRDSLDEFLSLPVSRLHYSNLNSAERVLRSLLGQGE